MAHKTSEVDGPFYWRKRAEAMPPKAAKRIFYTSDHSAEFVQKDLKELDENFQEVFDIGLRDTKYMDLPTAGSNLPNWDDVEYRREFHRKPPLDLLENRIMAQKMKRSEKQLLALPPVKASLYRDDFQGPSGALLKETVRASFPAEEPGNGSSRTLGGKGTWMVHDSHSHEHYVPLTGATRAKSVPKITHIKFGPTNPKAWTSQYSRSHSLPPGCSPIPARPWPGRIHPKNVDKLMNDFKKELLSPSRNVEPSPRPF